MSSRHALKAIRCRSETLLSSRRRPAHLLDASKLDGLGTAHKRNVTRYSQGTPMGLPSVRGTLHSPRIPRLLTGPRGNQARPWLSLAHVAFDDQHAALARKRAAQSAVRQIDNADLSSRRKQMARDGAADTLRPASDQGDRFCDGHLQASPISRVRRVDRDASPIPPKSRRRDPWVLCRVRPARR
jgi:hypothetical protein